MYFHIENYEYFKQTSQYYPPNECVTWQSQMKIVVYQLYYTSYVQLQELQKVFSEQKILDLNRLPSGIGAVCWKLLSFKNAFQNVFPTICMECSIHASVLNPRKSNMKNVTTKEENLCCICMDQPAQLTLCCCMTSYCNKCLQDWNKKEMKCPVCRKPMDSNQPSFKKNDKMCFENLQLDTLSRDEVIDMIVQFINRQ
jgi:hypothetical protein